MYKYHTVSPERAHSVTFSSQSLLLVQETDILVTWPTDQFIPEISTINDEVIISIYIQDQETWKLHAILVENTPNDGEEMINIPSKNFFCRYPVTITRGGFSVCPVALKISLRQDPEPPNTIGVWSGVAFLNSRKEIFQAECDSWLLVQQSNSASLRSIASCPPNQLVANFDIKYEREDRSSVVTLSKDYEEKFTSYFHPNVGVCYRQNL